MTNPSDRGGDRTHDLRIKSLSGVAKCDNTLGDSPEGGPSTDVQESAGTSSGGATDPATTAASVEVSEDERLLDEYREAQLRKLRADLPLISARRRLRKLGLL